jgi:hypothetical protein
MHRRDATDADYDELWRLRVDTMRECSTGAHLRRDSTPSIASRVMPVSRHERS